MAPKEGDRARNAEERAVNLAGEHRIGLGCMALTGIYGAVSRKQAAGTLTAALDNGITLFDTAPLYGNGANEALLGNVLGGRRDVTIVTKFGFYADAGGSLYRDSRPETIRQSIDASLRRLKRDRIDLLLQHRADPETPDDDVQACIEDLISAGKVGEFGISSVSAGKIEQWPTAGALNAVQNELSLVTGPRTDEVAAAMARGACFMAFSPLGRGILTGSNPTRSDDFRSKMPAFAKRSMSGTANVGSFAASRRSKEQASARRALAWVLAQGPHVVAIPGCRTPEQVSEIFEAVGDSSTIPESKEKNRVAQDGLY